MCRYYVCVCVYLINKFKYESLVILTKSRKKGWMDLDEIFYTNSLFTGQNIVFYSIICFFYEELVLNDNTDEVAGKS